jgi:hypothetical protein
MAIELLSSVTIHHVVPVEAVDTCKRLTKTASCLLNAVTGNVTIMVPFDGGHSTVTPLFVHYVPARAVRWKFESMSHQAPISRYAEASVMICPQFVALLLAFEVLTNVLNAGSLRKVWDFQTRTLAESDVAGDPFAVFNIGFSRDGSRIAVVVGRSWREEFLLVLNAQSPESHPQRIDVNPQTWPGRWATPNVDWSLSGQQVLLAGKLVDIRGGKSCVTTGTRFVSSNQIAGYQPNPARLALFDLECRTVGGWDLPLDDRIENWDASPERAILFVKELSYPHHVLQGIAQFITEADHTKITRDLGRWQWHYGDRSIPDHEKVLASGRFAESGKTLCGLRGDEWHRTIECVSVDSGQTLAATKERSNPEIRTAIASSRVVISEYARKLDWIDLRWYTGALRSRVIWDFRSGKTIARWKPKDQKVVTGDYGARSSLANVPQTRPYLFDISPDGGYLVEGGAGVISLYKIED